MLEVTDRQTHVLARFLRQAGGPEWLKRIREEASELFLEFGFPTPKNEEWKYTNVAALTKLSFEFDGMEPVADIEPVGGYRLVFANGVYAPELSREKDLPAGVRVTRFEENWEAPALSGHFARHAGYEKPEEAFVALNTASCPDGVLVEIDRGVVVGRPIHLVFLSSAGVMTNTRVLVVAGRASQAAVVEEFAGRGAYFTNAVTELIAEDDSILTHYKVQRESREAFHISTIQGWQGRNTNLVSHSVSLGALLARNDINSLLDDEGGECTLNGLFLADGRQHVDHHTRLDHAKPNCRSREFYRGVLGGSSMGVFNGKIIVRKDAQKTDAIQSNKNLLLSQDAVINTKPQLEIWADDVRCTHGATVGQLDKDALFYLRSRGVDDVDAKNLLTHAFANDVIERMNVEPIRERLRDALLHRFLRSEQAAARGAVGKRDVVDPAAAESVVRESLKS